MDRAIGWGVLSGKGRAAVERFLGHSNPRVRHHAVDVLAADRSERDELRRIREEDEAALDRLYEEMAERDQDPIPSDDELAGDGFDLDEILGSALDPFHSVPEPWRDDDGEHGPGPVPSDEDLAWDGFERDSPDEKCADGVGSPADAGNSRARFL